VIDVRARHPNQTFFFYLPVPALLQIPIWYLPIFLSSYLAFPHPNQVGFQKASASFIHLLSTAGSSCTSE
jgi:hypothetical protein